MIYYTSRLKNPSLKGLIMKYSALALSALITCSAYASEQSFSLTFFENAKKGSRECIKSGLCTGCIISYMGHVASNCPNPLEEAYDHTNLEDIISHGMYSSVYPQIEQCSNVAPYLGYFCCLAPIACFAISSIAEKSITCCTKSSIEEDKKNN